MAEVRVKRNSGPSGMADIRVLKNGLRISFDDGQVYDVPSDGKDYKPGRYNVTMSQDKSRIYGLRPPSGQYILEFKQWGNRVQGRAPGKAGFPASKVLRERVGHKKDGGTFPIAAQLVCVAEFVVASGQYQGLTSTTNVPYSFQRPESGNFVDYVDSRRNLERLENLFRCVTGKSLTDIDMEYSDDSTTLLLRYEKFMLSNSQMFLGNINDAGFVDLDTISQLPPELMPKKAAKKAPKKKGK